MELGRNIKITENQTTFLNTVQSTYTHPLVLFLDVTDLNGKLAGYMVQRLHSSNLETEQRQTP